MRSSSAARRNSFVKAIHAGIGAWVVLGAASCSVQDDKTVSTGAVGIAPSAVEATGSTVQPGSAPGVAPDFADELSDDGTGKGAVRRSGPPVNRFVGSAGKPLGIKPAPPARLPRGASDEERLFAAASAMPSTEPVKVILTLNDVSSDWTAFRAAPDAATRAALVAARKVALGPTQSSLRAWLTSKGAANVQEYWLSNALVADVPAGVVPLLKSYPGLTGMSLNYKKESAAYWNGLLSQNGMRTVRLHDSDIRGHDGSHSGRRRERIAVIDVGPIPVDHAGWKKSETTSAKRLIRYYTCSSFGCFDYLSNGDGSSHGSQVSTIAVGSIQAGQDPLFPAAPPPYGVNPTSDQRRRSGQLVEGYLLYYNSDDVAGDIAAMQDAVEQGADVINISSIYQFPLCDASVDGGVNAPITNATNAGTVIVASVGNGGHTGTCNIGSPAARTEVIGAGGLNSNSDLTPNYDSLGIFPASSQGGMPIVTAAGTNGLLSLVDLIAPACFSLLYGMSGGTSTYPYSGCGTSFSSPSIAGMVGLLRNAMWSVGFDRNDARLLMANVLLMGDGWNGTTRTTQGMDFVTGAGRARVHWPSSSDLTAPWGWGQRTVTLSQGQTATWPVAGPGVEDSRITQWKWSVLWTWNNASAASPGGLADVPDIDLYVDDVCTGTTVNLLSDIGYDVRARFRLSSSQIAGRCLQMRAYAFAVNGTVTIYSADYYHSGATGVH